MLCSVCLLLRLLRAAGGENGAANAKSSKILLHGTPTLSAAPVRVPEHMDMQTVLERCRSGTPPTVPERLCQNRRTVLEQYRSRTVRGVPERYCSGTVWGVLERLPFQNSIEPFWHVASLYKMKIHALHGYRPDILSTLKTHGEAHSRTRAVCALADRFCTPLGCVHVSPVPIY